MRSGQVLMGLLAGVAVGAAIGVLFAPGKGSATRRKIAHRGDEYLHELTDDFEAFVHNLTKKFTAIKQDAVRMAENGKAKVEEIVG